MKINIGITENNLEKSIALLSVLLADEMTLYVKTRKFHWNVSGGSFMELHKLFETQYAELEETIDLVAERIGKLGGKTIGTMKEFSAATRLTEAPGKYASQKEMLKELLDDHELLVSELRKDIDTSSEKSKDAGTIDFITGLMEQHETAAWVLRRYLN
ncbi:MAG: DNA starvation/stationary phase protection protein [Chitinophagaceae bacterium]|nr:DNA starvation/stationary phase protection protein [Chitinophagaceae bacterium]